MARVSEMIICDACGDSGFENFSSMLAADAAAEDARELGGRGPGDVIAIPCEECPRGSCCGRLVREHSDAELIKAPRPTHRLDVWDVPGCEELRPPIFVDSIDAEAWIGKLDHNRGTCESDPDADGRCWRHKKAGDIAVRLVNWRRRQHRAKVAA